MYRNKFPCHSCSQKLQLLHSPSTLLLLKQKSCYRQRSAIKISANFSFHLQLLPKVFGSLPRLKILCLHYLSNNFKLLSSLPFCSSEHGTLGKFYQCKTAAASSLTDQLTLCLILWQCTKHLHVP